MLFRTAVNACPVHVRSSQSASVAGNEDENWSVSVDQDHWHAFNPTPPTRVALTSPSFCPASKQWDHAGRPLCRICDTCADLRSHLLPPARRFQQWPDVSTLRAARLLFWARLQPNGAENPVSSESAACLATSAHLRFHDRVERGRLKHPSPSSIECSIFATEVMRGTTPKMRFVTDITTERWPRLDKSRHTSP